MSTPINLRSEFGHRWKIGLDEAAGGRWSDPWNYKVLCRYGNICTWGGRPARGLNDQRGRGGQPAAAAAFRRDRPRRQRRRHGCFSTGPPLVRDRNHETAACPDGESDAARGP
jgi:hypothetical protein